MAFPSSLITLADLQTYAHEQNVANFLEPGNNYTNLLTGSTDAVKRWLRSHGTDPDVVSNTGDYKPAAVMKFLSLVFAAQGSIERANWYHDRFRFEMADTAPELSSGEGGQVGRVVTIRRNAIDLRGTGSSSPYRRRRPGARFK